VNQSINHVFNTHVKTETRVHKFFGDEILAEAVRRPVPHTSASQISGMWMWNHTLCRTAVISHFLRHRFLSVAYAPTISPFSAPR